MMHGQKYIKLKKYICLQSHCAYSGIPEA